MKCTFCKDASIFCIQTSFQELSFCPGHWVEAILLGTLSKDERGFWELLIQSERREAQRL
jgi:hypothetical protein